MGLVGRIHRASAQESMGIVQDSKAMRTVGGVHRDSVQESMGIVQESMGIVQDLGARWTSSLVLSSNAYRASLFG